jgi:hypothetical protein
MKIILKYDKKQWNKQKVNKKMLYNDINNNNNIKSSNKNINPTKRPSTHNILE